MRQAFCAYTVDPFSFLASPALCSVPFHLRLTLGIITKTLSTILPNILYSKFFGLSFTHQNIGPRPNPSYLLASISEPMGSLRLILKECQWLRHTALFTLLVLGFDLALVRSMFRDSATLVVTKKKKKTTE